MSQACQLLTCAHAANCVCKSQTYSMTSSARARTVGGISRPSTFAALPVAPAPPETIPLPRRLRHQQYLSEVPVRSHVLLRSLGLFKGKNLVDGQPQFLGSHRIGEGCPHGARFLAQFVN